MGKTISEQIEELQCENTRLKNLEKLFDKMVKTALGMDLKSIRKILENHSSFKDNFIKKIADFYGLETEADYQDFLDTFCTNEFINHYWDYGCYCFSQILEIKPISIKLVANIDMTALTTNGAIKS